MKVKAIQCPLCKDTVYSRTSHDMRSCGCHQVSIDGGREYVKISWRELVFFPPEPFALEVEATSTQLFQDWNLGTNNYGRISNKSQPVVSGTSGVDS